MNRVASLRQTSRLCVGRNYANSAPESKPPAQMARKEFASPRRPAPPDLSSSGLLESTLSKAGEDTLAGNLLRNTQSGQNAMQKLEDRIKHISELRRLQRMAKNAEEEKLLAAATPEERRQARVPIERPASTFRRQVHPESTFERQDQQTPSDVRSWRPDNRLSNTGQNRGSPLRPRRASGGGAARSNNRRDREHTSAADTEVDKFVSQLTIESARAELANLDSEEFMDCQSDAPNSIEPTISHDLKSVFRAQRPPVEAALSKVSIGQTPPPSLAKYVLRRFGGDYSPSVPVQSKALYTTPVDQLPAHVQLQLAMAKSKDMNMSSRQFMSKLVVKNVGAPAKQAAIV